MKPLAITLGDPAGIGSEIVFKALDDLPPDFPVWVFGEWRYALEAAPRSETLRSLPRTRAIAPAETAIRLFVDTDLASVDPLRFGEIDATYGRVALKSIDLAVDAITRGFCSALVTAPIHKQAVAAAGCRFPGHTEILAEKAGLKRYGYDFAMYFDSPRLKVALASVHIALRDAIARCDAPMLAALIRLTDREYQDLYGAHPRIAVAGINPHAGEGGMFGDEEKQIAEAIERTRRDGLDVSGPHAPDTVFRSAVEGRYDVVVAMYHDQGLIPVKTIAFEESVNVTLGLPYRRCSVDHGTAFDIAGKGVADAQPMRYAIEWAAARCGALEVA